MAVNSNKLITNKPALSSPVYWAIALRGLMFVFILLALDKIVDFGTSPILLGLCSVAGIVAASDLSRRGLSSIKFLLLLAATVMISKLAVWSLGFLPTTEGSQLLAYVISLHYFLCLIVFSVAAVLTWLYWKTRWGLTLEALLLTLVPVYLLSGHRQLHLDRPQFLGDIAWYAQRGSLETIIGLAIAAFLILGIYVFILHKSWLLNSKVGVVEHRGKLPLTANFLYLIIAASVIWFASKQIFNHYNQMAITRTANGVGQAGAEDASPLGFHSALGGSNQPSALVRLDGDYKDNPFLPMLYLRESALSKFDGTEIVRAPANLNPDVQTNSPAEAYIGEEDPRLSKRVPLNHSVYVMGDHKTTFAVDYPLSITRLKSPSDRFKFAYKVYSSAPGFSLKELTDKDVGDPKWDKTTQEHFIEPHTDKRYSELAKKISADQYSPISKARAIVDYLSQNAIYTLTPGHEVEPGKDPVAPFLFGDNRGYCVHFAHAMVYMFRALGIPSRIGTGYLTDLSQSKDGHLLLRMSDRHAWAEIYIRDYGWIPFDPQPQQVESHAESPVDMNLLEELMGILEPDEEILPEELTKDEKGFEEEDSIRLPDADNFIYVLAIVIALLVLIKLYLLFSWIFPTSSRLKNAYTASLSSLIDLGFKRNKGETKQEFRTRVKNQLGKDPLSLTQKLNAVRYGGHKAESNLKTIKDSLNTDSAARQILPLWKRLIAFLNPSSVFHFIRRDI
ncbi:MAG: transglutaminase-like domain-containing protein [Bdellovibrionota bacterium]